MFFAVGEEQVIAGFGLPAGIVITSLVIALIFTVRLLLKTYDKIDSLREQQIKSANEVNDKLVVPIESIAIQTKYLYDNAQLNSRSRR